MRKLFIFSLLLIAISGINAQNRKLRANLLDKNNHSVMVVSHRGDWRMHRKILCKQYKIVLIWELIWSKLT